MKLKEYNAENCIATTTNRRPVITISKTGAFYISGSAVERVGLKDGDKIVLVQDQETPEDWYLLVGAEKGFTVKKKSATELTFQFNNTRLRDAILSSCSAVGGRMLVGAAPQEIDGKKYWPLITASLNKS